MPSMSASASASVASGSSSSSGPPNPNVRVTLGDSLNEYLQRISHLESGFKTFSGLLSNFDSVITRNSNETSIALQEQSRKMELVIETQMRAMRIQNDDASLESVSNANANANANAKKHASSSATINSTAPPHANGNHYAAVVAKAAAASTPATPAPTTPSAVEERLAKLERRCAAAEAASEEHRRAAQEANTRAERAEQAAAAAAAQAAQAHARANEIASSSSSSSRVAVDVESLDAKFTAMNRKLEKLEASLEALNSLPDTVAIGDAANRRTSTILDSVKQRVETAEQAQEKLKTFVERMLRGSSATEVRLRQACAAISGAVSRVMREHVAVKIHEANVMWDEVLRETVAEWRDSAVSSTGAKRRFQLVKLPPPPPASTPSTSSPNKDTTREQGLMESPKPQAPPPDAKPVDSRAYRVMNADSKKKLDDQPERRHRNAAPSADGERDFSGEAMFAASAAQAAMRELGGGSGGVQSVLVEL